MIVIMTTAATTRILIAMPILMIVSVMVMSVTLVMIVMVMSVTLVMIVMIMLVMLMTTASAAMLFSPFAAL